MFFRKKTELEPVTPADAEEARRVLQRTTSFDIDEFLRGSTVEVLFHSPLGPFPQCLNVDELAAAKDEALAPSRRAHLLECPDCADHLRTYQSLEEVQWIDVSRHIEIMDFIRVPSGGELFLVVRNLGTESILGAVDTIRVDGAIDGVAFRISKLDPAEYQAAEAVCVHFGKNFTLNVPETGQVVDYVNLYAETASGSLYKRQLVRIVDESKLTATVAMSVV